MGGEDAGAQGRGAAGTVVLTRAPVGVRGRVRGYTVLVDEAEAGRVRKGGVLRLEVGAGTHEVRLATRRRSSAPVAVAVEPGGTVHLVCGPGAPPERGIALLPTPEQPLGDGIRRIGPVAFAAGIALLAASWAWEAHADWDSPAGRFLAEAGSGCLAVWVLARFFVRREVRRAVSAGGRSR